MEGNEKIIMTRDQMIDAFHAWNKRFMENDPMQLKEIEDTREFAEAQADELIEIFESM